MIGRGREPASCFIQAPGWRLDLHQMRRSRHSIAVRRGGWIYPLRKINSRKVRQHTLACATAARRVRAIGATVTIPRPATRTVSMQGNTFGSGRHRPWSLNRARPRTGGRTIDGIKAGDAAERQRRSIVSASRSFSPKTMRTRCSRIWPLAPALGSEPVAGSQGWLRYNWMTCRQRMILQGHGPKSAIPETGWRAQRPLSQRSCTLLASIMVHTRPMQVAAEGYKSSIGAPLLKNRNRKMSSSCAMCRLGAASPMPPQAQTVNPQDAHHC